MADPGLGIRRIEAIHTYVRDLERSRRFYTEKLDFAEVAESGAALTGSGRQRSIILEAGRCRVVCSSPAGEGGRAHRYLRKHPDGIGSIVFEVENIGNTFATIESRGGTPIADIEVSESASGTFKTFLVATPFGDTTFRFIERQGNFVLYPGFDVHARPRGGGNAFGFSDFDHVTSNFETLAPALLWMKHVLGFERFWQVAFHTDDVGSGQAPAQHAGGSGLRSVVMWDPTSGVKFANNEPQRPSFKTSQINIFHEDHRGDGVQHVAIGVANIVDAVRGMRQRGVEFMPTPKAYYRALPDRLRELGVGAVAEPLSDLEDLEVLVDGDGPGRYLLQIFLKDSAGTHGTPEAGPFFFEIIQRRGDEGFGAGNFRALFESIEREQQAERPSTMAEPGVSPQPGRG
jgi:4-hydroxyphenylpyruvate dioxygenase